MIFARKYLLYFIIIIIIAVLETVIATKVYPTVASIKNDIWRIYPSPGDPDRNIYTRSLPTKEKYGGFPILYDIFILFPLSFCSSLLVLRWAIAA